MGLFSKLFSNNNNVTVVNTQQPEVYNVQAIHEQIKVDPNYRAATTQPSIFLNGNYVGNVTVFSFLGINWTVTTQDGIVSIQTTGGGGGGSFVVKKDGTVIVASTTNLNFTGTNITVSQDLVNPNQANISVTGGGGLGAFLGTFFTYTYSYPQTFGQYPLLFNLLDATSILPSPPTGWLWSVDGGTEGTDYIFTTGKGKTTQNPQVRFNVPPNLQEGYTLTLLPSSTAIPPVTYLPYSIQIPPQPLPFTTGNYNFVVTFNQQGAYLLPYWSALSTDVFVFTGEISSYLKCASITITIFPNTTQPNVPTFTITANDLNVGNAISSSIISAQSFPVFYQFDVQAYMYNSDGITSTLVEQFNDPTQLIGYYVPALYIQNTNLTAPTFDITSNQVGNQNYVAGLSVFISGRTGQQVMWVAFPKVFPTRPLGLVVAQGDFTGFTDVVSQTPVIQTIAGQVYYIYGYIVGYPDTGFITYNSELFLEIIPNIDDPDTNLLLKTQAKEVPKTGFFTSIKRLFGAKS